MKIIPLISLFLTLLSSASLCISAPISATDSVLVIGATGGTGSLIVKELQKRNIQVIAGVRNMDKARRQLGAGTTLVQLDLTDKASLVKATKGIAAVVNAASAKAQKPSEDHYKAVDYNGTVKLIEAAKTNQVKKILLVSSMGVTDKDHFLNKVANNVLIWKYEGEKALAASGIDYTIVRPGGLTNGPANQSALKFMQGDAKGSGGRINRSDVALVCVEALFSADASNKTFEIVATDGPALKDYSPCL